MAQLFNSTKMFSPEEKSLSSSQMRLEMENVDDEDEDDNHDDDASNNNPSTSSSAITMQSTN